VQAIAQQHAAILAAGGIEFPVAMATGALQPQLAPIFIVGCPRSGTTLLRNLLRSHPRLTFPGESHFIPAFYRRYGDPSDARAASRLGQRILALEWIRWWNLPLLATDFAPDRTFRAVIERLHGAWAAKEQKPRWGDKTPHYVAFIPELLAIFPEARIIHIIRDGRDVALSWLRTGFEPRNLYTAARLWNSNVRKGLDAARASREAVLEIRYEDLVTETGAVLAHILGFIGETLPPGGLTLNPLGRPTRRRRGFTRRRPKLQKAFIDRSSVGAWRTSMAPADRVIFESVAGALLGELGYEREGRIRRISDAERAYWTLHHRARWTLSRLKALVDPVWLVTEYRLRR
jgi:hypothetical protein